MIRNMHSPPVEMIVKRNIVGMISVENAQIVGLPSSRFQQHSYGLVPASESARLVIATKILGYVSRKVMKGRPSAAELPEELRGLYITSMPEKSVQGSCAFHGPEGCGLDRRIRARICNRYRCLPMQLFLRTADGAPDGPGLLIGAGDDAAPVVATVLADGTRDERPIGLAEEASDSVIADVAAQVPEAL